MGRFVEGADRRQIALLPDCLDDYVAEDNPVRVVDAFVDELDLVAKPLTSGAKADGRFGKEDFVFLSAETFISARRARSCPGTWQRSRTG